MRPPRNAIIGYSYQKTIAFLLLALMDSERIIDRIEIEAIVDHNFDDVGIVIDNTVIYCQMKDFNDVEIKNIVINNDVVKIKGVKHSLSKNSNVIFIKEIDIVTNTHIFGIPALLMDNVYIVSLTRGEAREKISLIYQKNQNRIDKLEIFFDRMFDDRKLLIDRSDLPYIELYSTELLEKTINVQDVMLSDSKPCHIVGKPGVGKSHLVNQLNIDGNNILYRFWTSYQDSKYKDRLEFDNFISNISKELFNKPIPKTKKEIILELTSTQTTLIIDGLDHVENYNPIDLDKYIEFINNLAVNAKVIVLSRPLKKELQWKCTNLINWDYEQTKKLLDEFYHIRDYSIQKRIFEITDGYPIIVSFIALHYKEYNSIPELDRVSNLNEYYDSIIDNNESKKALALFITSRSYYMISEISVFLEPYASELIIEFVNRCPYLFERNLNRISLIHDSFTTYLRNLLEDNSILLSKVKNIVFESISNKESRYLSRFKHFELPLDKKMIVLKNYSSIEQFEFIVNKCIDYESIVWFYNQLRDLLALIPANYLSLEEYYDLALIFNIIHRDHTSSVNNFYYNLALSFNYNGYTYDDVTSSDYLFSFLYLLEENDTSLIKRNMSTDNYSIDNLNEELNYEIYKEDNYFKKYSIPFKLNEKNKEMLSGDLEYEKKDIIKYILLSSYIHGVNEESFSTMDTIIRLYIDDVNPEKAKILLEKEMSKLGVRNFFSNSILNEVKDKLQNSGYLQDSNDYRNLAFGEFIDKYKEQGSFKVLEKVINYMRLALHERRQIDICRINKFHVMYHERKDYSALNIHSAFKVFETLGLIEECKSLSCIMRAQEMSEKGIRTILQDYIENHDISIVKALERNFELEDLNVQWFKLPSSYIDVFSDKLFHIAMPNILRSHQHSRKIDILDIENVIPTKRFSEFIDIIDIVKYSIEIDKTHEYYNELKSLGIKLSIITSEVEEETKEKSSADRISNGILTISDIEEVKKMNLKPSEIAGYTNGWYMLLSDIGIFSHYNNAKIQQEIFEIVRNSLVGRIENIDMFGSAYYLVGSLPELFLKYETDVKWRNLFSSYKKFLQLSGLD